MKSANDSLSQVSCHHFIVTRSPNHMCAISCAITVDRSTTSPASGSLRGTYSSRNVTHPAVSSAPQLWPGCITWS